MVKIVGSYASFDALTNREDLTKAIYNVDPTETPIISSVARTPATNTLHEWSKDVLDTVAQNAQLEGDEIVRSTSVSPTRPVNRTQISRKDATVTGTQLASDPAGKDNEMTYQLSIKSMSLRRDMENDYAANNARVDGNATTAREAAGIEAWLATNTNRGATGVDPTGDGSDAATDGTLRAFTEPLLQDVIAQCWDSGGKPDEIHVGSFNKQALSAFEGRASSRQTVDASTVHANVDLYASNFGDLRVVPNRFSRPESALVLQMDMWAMSTLRDMDQFALGKIGDADTEVLITEWTVEARNEKASGIVADLTIT